MKTGAHIVALHLENSGLGTFGGGTGWSINIATEPAQPDQALTVYDTGGDGEVNLCGGDERPMRFDIQVRARGDYTDVADKLHAVRTALWSATGEAFGTQVLHACWHRSGPFDLGMDDNNRHRLTDNWSVELRWL